MKFKRLKTDEELTKFIEETNQEIGIRYPLEYFKRSRVFAMFDNDEKFMVGGFVIVMEGPFIELESIPEVHRPKDICNDKKVGEVTALWLKREYRIKHSLKFWFRFFIELLSCGKRRFVYGYALKDHLLKRMYAKGAPEIIFRGLTKTIDPKKEPVVESVEIISVYKFFLIPLRNPDFFIKRIVRKYFNRNPNPKNK